MCGIAGVIKIHDPKDGPPPPPLEVIPESWLDILDESIKHRGPDGQGRFRDRAVREDGTIVDVALVHRRLSIIDHAGGHQPMVHDGDRLRPDLTYQPGDTPIIASEVEPDKPLVAVVFNGCIYNHRELRKELEGQGYVFETDHSDTEVLVHGWRAWGQGRPDIAKPKGKPWKTRSEGLPSKLEGMWAILCWLSQTGDITITNDRFREKRAWHTTTKTGLHLVSSSPAGILELTPPSVNPDLLIQPEFLRPLSRCIKTLSAPSQIEDLVSTSTWKKKTLLAREWNWYRNETTCRPVDRTRTLGVEEVDLLLAKSVEMRMQADVPVGIFLSGGIDSGLLAAHAHKLDSSIETLTVRMPDDAYDESDAASETAMAIGTRHRVIECSPEPASDLIKLIERLGFPFGDSSLLPTYWVSKAARDVVRVALSGDGGDELFAGYQRHQAAGLLRNGKSLLMLVPSYSLPQRDPKSGSARLARLGNAAREMGYPSLRDGFSKYQHDRLLNHNRLGMALSGVLCNAFTFGASFFGMYRVLVPASRSIAVSNALSDDLHEYLPDDLLVKTDTASMHAALEVRCPFLDSNLVQAATTATIDSLMPNGQRKGLLKQVARKYLPDHIVDRPKQGFAIPIGEWFRTDYGSMRQLLHDHLHSADPFPGLAEAGVEINMKFVEQMLREHDAAGEKSINPWHGRDHSQRLYMLLVLSIWAKWLQRVRNDAQEGA
ncbi:MAG: asparagine synthase (glutamine-hydrolyzing) [Phycisphaerae bacterium]|nr:asparagine synthase (glutamine-hydrolyzing) [Phycisphaerae bacterium]MBM92829.1 asparagine synthase (glutamine-hydrolyzing) [Phycisphaerae bacterium]